MRKLYVEQMDATTGLWESVERIRLSRKVPYKCSFLWWSWDSVMDDFKTEGEYRSEAREAAERHAANGLRTRIAMYRVHMTEEDDWTELEGILWIDGKWR